MAGAAHSGAVVLAVIRQPVAPGFDPRQRLRDDDQAGIYEQGNKICELQKLSSVTPPIDWQCSTFVGRNMSLFTRALHRDSVPAADIACSDAMKCPSRCVYEDLTRLQLILIYSRGSRLHQTIPRPRHAKRGMAALRMVYIFERMSAFQTPSRFCKPGLSALIDRALFKER